MKKSFKLFLLLFSAVLISSSLVTSCKSKVKDADVETSVTNSLRSNPDYASVSVMVKDGDATLSGEVKDAATKSSAESEAKKIKGVQKVTNNITIAQPVVTTPVEITADDPLTVSVRDAVKDNPGVTASVNDGVITLTGEIKRVDLPKLMQKLNALKPRKIENKLVIN